MLSLPSRFAVGALCAGAVLSASAQISDVLVAPTNFWSYRKGTSAPSVDWKLPGAALDSTWRSGRGGFGYASNTNETSQVRTYLFDMAGTAPTNYTAFFIRQEFTVGALDTNRHLSLVVDYDDGYIAFLDGAYLASANSPGAPAAPAFDAEATAGHESSRGNNTARPPATNALGAAGSRLAPGPHVLALVGLNDDADSSDCILIPTLYLVDAPTNSPGGTNGCIVSGAIASDATWYRTNSPYIVAGNITVNAGVTLTIEPGVLVLFNQGLRLDVSGRLLAEGTPTNRIVFSRNAGANSWSTLEFLASGSTSRIAHADIAYSTGNIDATGTTLELRGLWFTNTTAQMIDLVNSSVTLLDSYLPVGASELLHFSSFPAGGHALIKGNVFGGTSGYNDIIDFTGGNRPGPIVQFLDNIFLAGVDDCFDMDGTDAHIEGNVFLNVRKEASRDSSSNPITTGANGSDRSQLVICRNLFYDCEHAFMEKDHGTAILQNNTILRLSTNSVSDNTDPDGNEAPGIIMFGEPWRSGPPPAGDGVFFEGNIAADLRLSDPWPILSWAESFAGFFFRRDFNCIEGFPQPGLGNLSADPLFVSPSNITPANIYASLTLQPGSPCRGTGPNGLDMGALVPAGASVSGEPASPTSDTSATLHVAGPGIWSYRWRLNSGPWSDEVSLVPPSIWNGQAFTATLFSNAPPILLTNLADGTYTVAVIGRNSAGAWQDTNSPTVSRTWIVQTQPPLEITAVRHEGPVTTFHFHAVAGQTYTVQYSDSLHPILWQKLRDVTGQPTDDYEVTDILATGDSRFYRVVSPMQ